MFQGPPWIAEQAYDARPFEDVYALRRAFTTCCSSAARASSSSSSSAYPDIGSVFRGDTQSRRCCRSRIKRFAGLDRLDTDEHHNLGDLTSAYRKKFGFPLIIAVRENTKGDHPALRATPGSTTRLLAEQATALVEIAEDR